MEAVTPGFPKAASRPKRLPHRNRHIRGGTGACLPAIFSHRADIHS